VRITNVYNQTVVVNNRANNVSFNGGNGGTTIRPSAQQQAIAREPHVAATQLQRQQVEAASKDRGLFSKQNHGEPAVAATPRAGVFQGAGVSRGSRTPVAAKPANETPANGAQRPGSVETKETLPTKAGEKSSPVQQPREAQPANEKTAPKAEEQREPAREPSRPKEPRRPTEEQPKAQEPQRPMQEPKAVERPAQEPRVEEQRRPAEEPPMRAQEQPRPAPAPAQPRVNEARPAPQAMPQRPAAARPPAEEKR
jgi:hypothetical protein